MSISGHLDAGAAPAGAPAAAVADSATARSRVRVERRLRSPLALGIPLGLLAWGLVLGLGALVWRALS